MADCSGQRALVAGVGSFTRGWDGLPFAVERATEVGDALEDALGQALRDAGAGGALVVHLLSHGFQGRTGGRIATAPWTASTWRRGCARSRTSRASRRC